MREPYIVKLLEDSLVTDCRRFPSRGLAEAFAKRHAVLGWRAEVWIGQALLVAYKPVTR